MQSRMKSAFKETWVLWEKGKLSVNWTYMEEIYGNRLHRKMNVVIESDRR